MAASLGARRLIFLTDVEGVADALGRRIEDLDPGAARRLLESRAVSGGMRPKLAACLEAAAAGVREVVIAGPQRQEEAIGADGEARMSLRPRLPRRSKPATRRLSREPMPARVSIRARAEGPGLSTPTAENTGTSSRGSP